MKESEDIQMFKILVYANVWFSRSPYFIVNSVVNCSELPLEYM